MRTAARLGASVLAAALLAIAPASAAELEVVPGSLSVHALDAAGAPERRAGAHPDRLRIMFAVNSEEVDTALRELTIDLPPGLVGDPGAAEECPRPIFDLFGFGAPCPAASRIGDTAIVLAGGTFESGPPIFNVEPVPGELAAFGFRLLPKYVLKTSLRPTDYGLRLEQRDLTQAFSLTGVKIDLWGVPADHQEEGASTRRPFLTLPTRCGEPLEVTLRLRSWRAGSPWTSATGRDELPLNGCEHLSFAPDLGFGLTDSRPDSPTGARIDLRIPQLEDPDALASAHVRRATVELPEGTTISPGALESLDACADAELRRGSSEPSTCPPASKVGIVELVATQLREPLAGSLYLGEERPDDRFRLFAVARGAGVDAKLIGSLRVDPVGGRLRVVLPDLPQLPLERLSMRLDSGGDALLASPLRCGPTIASGVFEPYSGGPSVESSDTVAVEPASGPCPAQPHFAPRVLAGTTSARPARPTSFSTVVSRSDGEELLDRFAVRFPPGLSARLGAVERCETAAAAANRCPGAARVGSVVAQVGSGPSPAGLDGEVFLTGPYRRAPFGLAMVFKAVLGPFDLGTVVARAALRVDPESGRVSVEADPLPRAIEGLPVRFRAIRLDVDRPGFIRTPTSCAPASVDTLVRSAGGATVETSTRYALKGCERLRFAPRISLGLTGPSELRRGGRPGLRIDLRSKRGGANLRGVDVALPEMLRGNAAGLRSVCARQDARESRCPKTSRIGRASGATTVVRKRLGGPVHVVQPEGSGMPELWTMLDAEGVRLSVRGELRIRDGRMRTKLVGLPDVPLTRLSLRLRGGERGLVSLASDPCSGDDRRRRGQAAFEGHNGAYLISPVRFERRCGANPGTGHAGEQGAGKHHG